MLTVCLHYKSPINRGFGVEFGIVIFKKPCIYAGSGPNLTTLVHVPVTCNGKTYTGNVPELLGYYRIIGTGKDLSKCKITVKKASQSKLTIKNGEEVKLTKDDLEVTLGTGKSLITLGKDDYRIVSITNNTGVGSATLNIEGTGVYGGKKSVSLKITAKSMK